MKKNTKLQSYLSTTGNVLYLTPVFTYDITIYRIYKDRTELAYQNQKYSLSYIPINGNIIYKKYKDCIVSISIDWIGAPKYYLETNGYKLLNDYEDFIKQKRKRK